MPLSVSWAGDRQLWAPVSLPQALSFQVGLHPPPLRLTTLIPHLSEQSEVHQADQRHPAAALWRGHPSLCGRATDTARRRAQDGTLGHGRGLGHCVRHR